MQGHVQATYENPPHVYALADNMYRNMTIGLRSMMMMMMIGMTWHMIMIIDFLTCENIDIDSLIQQRLMVIIFNVLHLYLKKTMQQKTVQIKKIIRWTFRQWEPMCDHLGGVWGWQDCRRQVHHGLYLQGDADDENIDDGDEKWEKLKDSSQKLYWWYIMIEQNICSKMHLTIMMMLINRLWWKWRLALWKKCVSPRFLAEGNARLMWRMLSSTPTRSLKPLVGSCWWEGDVDWVLPESCLWGGLLIIVTWEGTNSF